MLIHPWDAATGEDEWRRFAIDQGFGHLVASGGPDRRRPVIVPTQFVLDDDVALIHLARPNPIWRAIEENSYLVLSIAGDWAYIPSSWKTVDEEDPADGVPTTYYGAVQLAGETEIIDDQDGKLALLRRQLAGLQPDEQYRDPATHHRLLPGIRGIRLSISDVQAKFKYGGNVDRAHRQAVADHLERRGRLSDGAARQHLLRRLQTETTDEP
jgi:transcriptional regulator